MRPLIVTFLILAPFIAFAQNYNLHPLPALAHAPVAHIAQVIVNNTGAKMSNVVHAVHELLS